MSSVPATFAPFNEPLLHGESDDGRHYGVVHVVLHLVSTLVGHDLMEDRNGALDQPVAGLEKIRRNVVEGIVHHAGKVPERVATIGFLRVRQADFAKRLAERMGALTVGHGLSGAQVGPLIDAKARNRVAALVREAAYAGASVLVGGEAVESRGSFCKPTVLVDVRPGSPILKTEIFGPVAPIQVSDTEDEAIIQAIASGGGLTAYAYTCDLSLGLRLLDGLDVEMIGLNRGLASNPAASFGGVKASGPGREGGREGVDEYLKLKYGSIAI